MENSPRGRSAGGFAAGGTAEGAGDAFEPSGARFCDRGSGRRQARRSDRDAAVAEHDPAGTRKPAKAGGQGAGQRGICDAAEDRLRRAGRRVDYPVADG